MIRPGWSRALPTGARNQDYSAVWCVSSAVVSTTIQLPVEVRQTRAELRGLVQIAEQDLLAQVVAIRQDATAQLSGTRRDLVRQLDVTRGDVLARVDDATAKADQRLGEVSANAKTLTEQTGQVAED